MMRAMQLVVRRRVPRALYRPRLFCGETYYHLSFPAQEGWSSSAWMLISRSRMGSRKTLGKLAHSRYTAFGCNAADIIDVRSQIGS